MRSRSFARLTKKTPTSLLLSSCAALAACTGVARDSSSGDDALGFVSSATTITPGADPKQGQSFLIGEGFNTAAENFSGTCIRATNVISPDQGFTIKHGEFTFDKSIDSATVMNTLGFDIGLKAHFSMISASANAHLAQATQNQTYSEVFTFISDYDTGTYRFDDQALPTAYTLTKQGADAQTAGTWNTTCGNEYIQQITTGARFWLVYRIDFLTEDDKSSFHADLTAEANFGGGSLSLATAVEGIANKYANRARVHIEVVQDGGDPTQLGTVISAPVVNSGSGADAAMDCDITNLQACHTAVKAALFYATDPQGFMKQLTLTNKNPISIFTVPWSELALQMGNVPILSSEIANARSALQTRFDFLLNLKVRVDRLLAQANVNMPSEVKDKLTAAQIKLSNDLALVTTAVGACWDSLVFLPDGTPSVQTVSACTAATDAAKQDLNPVDDGILAGAANWVIDAEYDRLGNANGFLGKPLNDPYWTGTSNEPGKARDYANGTIFWSPDTNAVELHGPILAKYNTLGAATGFYGFPSTSVSQTGIIPGGLYAKFAHGILYLAPQTTTAFGILSPIYDKYASLNWEGSPLGFVTADTAPTSDGRGRFNLFQGGAIYTNPNQPLTNNMAEAYYVRNATYAEWKQLGTEAGYLGYPTSDQHPVGAWQETEFEGGAIVERSASEAHALAGGFASKWDHSWSFIGAPAQDAFPDVFSPCHNSYQLFDDGEMIQWGTDAACAVNNQTVEIYGALYRAWKLDMGRFGLPITDVIWGRSGQHVLLASGGVIGVPYPIANQSAASTGFWIDPQIAQTWLDYKECIGYPKQGMVNATRFDAAHILTETGSIYYWPTGRIMVMYENPDTGERKQITDPYTCQ